MQIEVTPSLVGIARLSPKEDVPQWAIRSSFFSITKTGEELSIACDQNLIPPGVKFERGWRLLKVKGPLDFALTGVLSSLAEPLAKARISIFAVSTFNTDYILVKQDDFIAAVGVLREAGHIVTGIEA